MTDETLTQQLGGEVLCLTHRDIAMARALVQLRIMSHQDRGFDVDDYLQQNGKVGELGVTFGWLDPTGPLDFGDLPDCAERLAFDHKYEALTGYAPPWKES